MTEEEGRGRGMMEVGEIYMQKREINSISMEVRKEAKLGMFDGAGRTRSQRDIPGLNSGGLPIS